MSKQTNSVAERLVKAANGLKKQLSQLDLSRATPWVYNPLEYAWEAHRLYISKYAQASCEVLMIGMNPGPWGMSQTGVPFGEVSHVRDWLRIDAKISKPDKEHPKRPVLGLDCQRAEVSGSRFWGFFRARFETPDKFFKKHFVVSYCPLAFMEESGLNVTPDKLPVDFRGPLERCCDQHLATVISTLRPKWLIGVGAWAEKRAKVAAGNLDLANIQVGRILHPSPASPRANRQWAVEVEQQLIDLGVWS